jgi:curved DNA-binding protein
MNLDLYALGGVLTVNTFDGKVKLKVTEGTQNDTKNEIERKRIPSL